MSEEDLVLVSRGELRQLRMQLIQLEPRSNHSDHKAYEEAYENARIWMGRKAEPVKVLPCTGCKWFFYCGTDAGRSFVACRGYQDDGRKAEPPEPPAQSGREPYEWEKKRDAAQTVTATQLNGEYLQWQCHSPDYVTKAELAEEVNDWRRIIDNERLDWIRALAAEHEDRIDWTREIVDGAIESHATVPHPTQALIGAAMTEHVRQHHDPHGLGTEESHPK